MITLQFVNVYIYCKPYDVSFNIYNYTYHSNYLLSFKRSILQNTLLQSKGPDLDKTAVRTYLKIKLNINLDVSREALALLRV